MLVADAVAVGFVYLGVCVFFFVLIILNNNTETTTEKQIGEIRGGCSLGYFSWKPLWFMKHSSRDLLYVVCLFGQLYEVLKLGIPRMNLDHGRPRNSK